MFEQPADFLAESDALHDLLERLPDADFDRPTRFKQWTINHVLAHLHLGNWAALETVINEPGYLAFRAERKATVPPMPMREFEKRWAGGRQGRALLAAWRELYPQVARTFQATDPKRRLKWAGPDMSARSSISARLMETWAHGQAVYAAACAACHAAGVLGAPKLGDVKAWAPLIKEGQKALTRTAIKGIRQMPPKGGNASLSNAEVERAVVHMANAAGGKFKDPR